MIQIDSAFDRDCEEYLLYLYELAMHKYSDCDDIDSLVQDSMMALIIKKKQGNNIEYPKGFLSSVMKNKYNEWLRKKYKNSILCYEYEDISDWENSDCISEENDVHEGEYALVRREVGRLINIYREVIVRHYVHGHSVEKIAKDLNISLGTVKSRLSSARNQIKEGIKQMEKYSQISYEPKNLSIGIWGSRGLNGEPFSLLHSYVEKNILIIAYEKPISIKEIADTIGMPSAYIEPIVDTLISGELMGKTKSGLVYTRCFVQKYSDAFGDIAAQEALADKYAEQVWKIVWDNIEPLTKHMEFSEMSEKQKATMMLFVMNQTLNDVVVKCRPVNENAPKQPPERPNGGRWLATATVSERNQKLNKYIGSGPVHVFYSSNNDGVYDCKMLDCQSLFGDAHWAYAGFKYKCTLQDVLRLYASFLPCNVKPYSNFIYELIPDFENLGILRRREDGEMALDIPVLTFEEETEYWTPAFEKIQKELLDLLKDEISALWINRKNRVPKHVDEYQYFLHTGALGAYTKAQMLAIVNKNLMPYPVEVGKTPIIYVAYRKSEKND